MFAVRAGCLVLLGLGLIRQVTADPFGGADFNTLQLGEQVLNYYDGGFGSLGSGPGPNFGITFTSDFAIVNQGVIFPDFDILQGAQLTSASGTMNVNGGFSGPFSFYYEGGSPSTSAELFSGLDGTGTQVGNLSLTPEGGFFPAGDIFPNFESVVFLSTPNTLVIDNVTFGGLVLPEPSMLGLFTVGLVGLGFWRRVRR
jgi:PEP-CTERM motif